MVPSPCGQEYDIGGIEGHFARVTLGVVSDLSAVSEHRAGQTVVAWAGSTGCSSRSLAAALACA